MEVGEGGEGNSPNVYQYVEDEIKYFNDRLQITLQ